MESISSPLVTNKYTVCRDGFVVFKTDNYEEVSAIMDYDDCIVIVNNKQQKHEQVAKQLSSAHRIFKTKFKCHHRLGSMCNNIYLSFISILLIISHIFFIVMFLWVIYIIIKGILHNMNFNMITNYLKMN